MLLVFTATYKKKDFFCKFYKTENHPSYVLPRNFFGICVNIFFHLDYIYLILPKTSDQKHWLFFSITSPLGKSQVTKTFKEFEPSSSYWKHNGFKRRFLIHIRWYQQKYWFGNSLKWNLKSYYYSLCTYNHYICHYIGSI